MRPWREPDALSADTHVNGTQTNWPWLFSHDSAAPEAAGRVGAAAAAGAAVEEPQQLTMRERAESARLRDDYLRKASTKAYQTMRDARARLPTFQMRSELLRVIAANQVVVVSGETGAPLLCCGCPEPRRKAHSAARPAV